MAVTFVSSPQFRVRVGVVIKSAISAIAVGQTRKILSNLFCWFI